MRRGVIGAVLSLCLALSTLTQAPPVDAVTKPAGGFRYAVATGSTWKAAAFAKSKATVSSTTGKVLKSVATEYTASKAEVAQTGAHIDITGRYIKGEVRTLAYSRALAVKNYMVKTLKVPASMIRIYPLKTAKPLPSTKNTALIQMNMVRKVKFDGRGGKFASAAPTSAQATLATTGADFLDATYMTGGKLVKPADPTRDGFVFKGWGLRLPGVTDVLPYTIPESEYINFSTYVPSFTTAAAADLKLYAQWVEVTPGAIQVLDATMTYGSTTFPTFSTDQGSTVVTSMQCSVYNSTDTTYSSPLTTPSQLTVAGSPYVIHCPVDLMTIDPSFSATEVLDGALTVTGQPVDVAIDTSAGKTKTSAPFDGTSFQAYATAVARGTTTSSTGAVHFTADAGSACTVTDSGVVTPTGIGTCTLRASVDAAGDYAAGVSSPQAITITAISRTVSITGYTSQYTTQSNGPTLSLSYSAGAGVGTVTYRSVTSAGVDSTSPCSINAATGKVSIQPVTGTCYFLAAVAAGNDGTYTYQSADAARVQFNVVASTRDATFSLNTDPLARTFTYTTVAADMPVATIVPTLGSGDVSYAVTAGSTYCSIDALGKVTLRAAGTCTISGTVAAFGGYDAVTKTMDITVSKANRTVTLSGVGATNYAFDVASKPKVSATTPYVTAPTYTYAGTTGICTVDSTGQLAFIAIGSCTVTVTAPADAQYNVASATKTFTIDAAPRTLTLSGFTASYPVATGTPPTLSALATVTSSGATASGGTLTYSSVDSSGSASTAICTVNSSSGAVTLVRDGTCYIKADLTASGNYAAATRTINFAVAPSSITLQARPYTVDPLNPTTIEAPFPGTASSAAWPMTIDTTYAANLDVQPTCVVHTVGSSTALTYSQVNSTVGTYIITCSGGTPKPGYAIAGYIDGGFTVTKIARDPTLVGVTAGASYGLLTGKLPSNLNVTAVAHRDGTTALNDGTTTFTATPSSVCTVDNTAGANHGRVQFVSAGTCTVSGVLGATGDLAATAATTPISFSVTKVARTLTINPTAVDSSSTTTTLTNGYELSALAPVVTATDSSGTYSGTLAFSSSTPSVCTIDSASGQLTFVSRGDCTIGAAITDSPLYADATAASVTFTIKRITRTLTIDALNPATTWSFGSAGPTLSATPSAGVGTGVISYSVPTTTTICSVSGAAVTFIHAGTCKVQATITESGDYSTATSADLTIAVGKQSITVTAENKTAVAPAPSSALTYADVVTFATDSASYFTSQPTCQVYASADSTHSGGAIAYKDLVTGSYRIACSGGTAKSDYEVGTWTDGTLTVTARPRTIAFTAGISGSSHAFNTTVSLSTTSTDTGASATANDGTLTYTTVDGLGAPSTAVCSVSGSTLSFANTGTCRVTASRAASGVFAATDTATATITVTAVRLYPVVQAATMQVRDASFPEPLQRARTSTSMARRAPCIHQVRRPLCSPTRWHQRT